MTNQPPSTWETQSLVRCSPYAIAPIIRSETHLPISLKQKNTITSGREDHTSPTRTKRAFSGNPLDSMPPLKKIRAHHQSDVNKNSISACSSFETATHSNLATQNSLPNMQGKSLQRKQDGMAYSSDEKVAMKRERTRPLNPSQFVRQLLNKSERNNVNCPHEALFTKPTEEELAAYTHDVVCAVRGRDLESLRSLHASGRTLHCSNRFGESLLHMACRRGYNDVVEFLLEDAGVPVRIKDDFGRTPVHDACWTPQPNYDLVRILLTKDPTLALVADVRGHTPFDYVRREHWAGWNKFLEESSCWLSTKEEQKSCQ